jgi:MYXO-CTERM domain-containing protein
MRARRRLTPFVLALCALPAFARPAAAFVRSVTDASTPDNPIYLYWPSSCETATIYLNGFTDMTADEVAKSIAGAAAAWGPDQVTCPSATGDGGNGHPSFEIITQLSTGGAVPGVASDGKNSIIFETTDWGDNDPLALAFTSVWREPSGQIVDADIEINATDPTLIAWANLDPGGPPYQNAIVPFDLQTVMTHEFGHFLGLAHTCVLSGYSSAGSPSGDNGDGPSNTPSCAGATPAELLAVMYPQIQQGSIANRVLTADDARGVCAIYDPSTPGPHLCAQNTPDDGCGCATAGTGLGSGATAALVALALARPRRRRRR